MLAPPVGSAAAIAAMLGFLTPFALLVTLAASLASSLYLRPLAAALADTHLDLHAVHLANQLTVIVGGSCIAAAALRWYTPDFVRNDPHAMTGVAVLGLILVAVGAMHGMQHMLRAETTTVILYLLIAFTANIGFQILGFALFVGRWPTRTLTIGLVSGNRNVTLIWAAIGTGLIAHLEVEPYLAVSVIPIFVLPALSRLLINRCQAPASASIEPADLALRVPVSKQI